MQKGGPNIDSPLFRAGQGPLPSNWFDAQVKRAGTAPIYQFNKNPRQQQKLQKQTDDIIQIENKQKKISQTPQLAVKNDIKQISKIYSCNSVKLKEKLIQQQQFQQKQKQQQVQYTSRPYTQQSTELENKQFNNTPNINSNKQYQLSNMMTYLNQGRQFYWSNQKKEINQFTQIQSPKQIQQQTDTNIFANKVIKPHPNNQRSFSRNLVRTHVSLKKEDIPLKNSNQIKIKTTKTVHDDKKDPYNFSSSSPPPLQILHPNKKVSLQQYQLQQQKQQIKQYQQQQEGSIFPCNRPQSSIGRRVKKERENSTMLEQSNSKQDKFYSLVQEDQKTPENAQIEFPVEHGHNDHNHYSYSRRTNYNRPPSQVGIRRKDYNHLSNTNQELFFGSILHNESHNNADYSKRPQSRQKTPQKALELELEDDGDNVLQDIPVKSMFEQDIPIKSMYESSFQDIDDIHQQELSFSKVNGSSQEEIHLIDNPNNQSIQSVDIQNTYKIIDKQMTDQPNEQQNQTITTKLDGSNILVKHVLKNNQTNLSRNHPNLSIPFETSLGNDFLSLFANTKEQLYN